MTVFMNESSDYTPPPVWSWTKENGGRFAGINRPTAGATHGQELPVGRHPLQLYSVGTPEWRQGHGDAGRAARARPRRRGVRRLVDPDQRRGAVRQRLRRRQSELEDPGAGRPQRAGVRSASSSRARSCSTSPRSSAAPFFPPAAASAPSACRGCSGRSAPRRFSAAGSATSTRTRRARSNTRSTATRWRSSASSTCSIAASPRARTSRATTTRSPTWRSGRGTARSPRGSCTDRASFCRCTNTRTSCAGPTRSRNAPPVRRGRMVNRTWGQPSSQLHERHDASDFDLRTQDKLAPAD